MNHKKGSTRTSPCRMTCKGLFIYKKALLYLFLNHRMYCHYLFCTVAMSMGVIDDGLDSSDMARAFAVSMEVMQ